MASVEGERKLTTILAADVVGFSKLAGADEERTLARLRGRRSDLIDPMIAARIPCFAQKFPVLQIQTPCFPDRPAGAASRNSNMRRFRAASGSLPDFHP